jgi:hypothetical protein
VDLGFPVGARCASGIHDIVPYVHTMDLVEQVVSSSLCDVPIFISYDLNFVFSQCHPLCHRRTRENPTSGIVRTRE